MRDRVIALVAHYDRHDKVDPYFVFLIQQLQEVAGEILVLSASNVSFEDQGKLGSGVRFLNRVNIGYDFGGWKDGLAAVGDLSRYDSVILANDSVYVSRHCFAGFFDLMANVDCGVWGITESLEIGRHLQSYFLVLRPGFFRGDAFKRFWSEMDFTQDKDDVILKGEVGLSQVALQSGLGISSVFRPTAADRFRVLWRVSEYAAAIRKPHGSARRLQAIKEVIVRAPHLNSLVFNPTHLLWDRLLKNGVGLIKVELLRSNPLRLDLSEARSLLSVHQFPVEKIDAHLKRVYDAKLG